MYGELRPRLNTFMRWAIINQHNRYSDSVETLPDQCCTIPPFQSDYSPIGRKFKIKVEGQEELEIYSTGSVKSRIALLSVHGKREVLPDDQINLTRADIFGFHNNTFQGADHLANICSYRIVIPDLFRGQGWSTDNIPPKEGRPVLDAWIQRVGSWERVRPGLLEIVQCLRKDGARSIGVSIRISSVVPSLTSGRSMDSVLVPRNPYKEPIRIHLSALVHPTKFSTGRCR